MDHAKNLSFIWQLDRPYFIYLGNTMINSVPNYTILDWSKLKAFADNKIKVLKMIILVFDRVKNTVGRGENAGGGPPPIILKSIVTIIRVFDAITIIRVFATITQKPQYFKVSPQAGAPS